MPTSPHDEGRSILNNLPSPDEVPNLPDPSGSSLFNEIPEESSSPAPGEAGQLPTLDVIPPNMDPLSDKDDPDTLAAYATLERHKRERRRKRIIRGAIVAAIALAALGFLVLPGLLGGESGESEDPIATAMVYRGDVTDSITSSGAAKPVDSVVVTPEVDGIIASVEVTEGQQVKAGDLLLTIKNDELDRDVRKAELAVQSAQSAVDQAQRAYDQAGGGNGPNGNGGYGDGGSEDIPGVEYVEGLGADAASVESAREDARIALETAQMELQSAQEALEQARSMAAKREVRAPQDGTVIALSAEVGAPVGGTGEGGSGSLATNADLSRMTVRVQVNENDITKISKDQAATITFSALPDVQLTGTVTRISAMPSGGNAGEYYEGGGSTSYDVDILIPEPDARIKPGMTADVEIVCSSFPDALVVPSTAVQGEGEWASVIVVTGEGEEQEFTEVLVTVLGSNGYETAVQGELEEGDEVLLGGADMGEDEVYSEDFTAAG